MVTKFSISENVTNAIPVNKKLQRLYISYRLYRASVLCMCSLGFFSLAKRDCVLVPPL